MNVYLFNGRVMVLLLSVAIVCGCRPAAVPFEGRSMKQVPPGEFYTDPLQVQLAVAVDEGDAAAVEAAVRDGADVNAFGAHGFRLLFWTLCRENVRGFELLLRHGASLDEDVRDLRGLPRPHRRESVLGATLASHDVRFLDAALRCGLDANYMPLPSNKRTLLFMAAQRDSLPAVKTLLAAGAEIDWREESGQTVLMQSMFRCDYATARFLIDNGAEPTIKDNDGHDFVWGLKEWGSRGVWPEQREGFEAVVAELIRRGLLTRQDIVEADKPKTPNSGITVIEHSSDSEAGQELLRLDQTERDFYERQRRAKTEAGNKGRE
jgi:uncharacterized protein